MQDFPAVLAKEKAYNLERSSRSVWPVNKPCWRSWGQTVAFNTKLLLNFSRLSGHPLLLPDWLVTCRVCTETMRQSSLHLRFQWKRRADVAARTLSRTSRTRFSSMWRYAAMRGARRIQQYSHCIRSPSATWTEALAVAKREVESKRVTKAEYLWAVSARVNTVGRFSEGGWTTAAYRSLPLITWRCIPAAPTQ